MTFMGNLFVIAACVDPFGSFARIHTLGCNHNWGAGTCYLAPSTERGLLCGSPRMSPQHTFGSLSMCQRTLKGALVHCWTGDRPQRPVCSGFVDPGGPSLWRRAFAAFRAAKAGYPREKDPQVRALHPALAEPATGRARHVPSPGISARPWRAPLRSDECRRTDPQSSAPS